jgi:hypothetical protein
MSKFKDSMNRWVTTGLFTETAGQNKEFITYTLDEARELFLATQDITGYTFAKQHLGGLSHWKALQSSPVMSPILDEWLEEMEVAKRAESLLRIEKTAREGHFQANKFLSDRGWEKHGRGRPSKSDVEKERNKQTKSAGQVVEYLRPIK